MKSAGIRWTGEGEAVWEVVACHWKGSERVWRSGEESSRAETSSESDAVSAAGLGEAKIKLEMRTIQQPESPPCRRSGARVSGQQWVRAAGESLPTLHALGEQPSQRPPTWLPAATLPVSSTTGLLFSLLSLSSPGWAFIFSLLRINVNGFYSFALL